MHVDYILHVDGGVALAVHVDKGGRVEVNADRLRRYIELNADPHFVTLAWVHALLAVHDGVVKWAP